MPTRDNLFSENYPNGFLHMTIFLVYTRSSSVDYSRLVSCNHLIEDILRGMFPPKYVVLALIVQRRVILTVLSETQSVYSNPEMNNQAAETVLVVATCCTSDLIACGY